MKALKIPKILSYKRSINPTDARMFASDEYGENLQPLIVRSRSIRSPFSNFSETKNVEKNPARGNPKNGDIAVLPPGTNTLIIKFSASFTGNSLSPHSCARDSADVREAMISLTDVFGKKGGYRVLAERYVDRILDGSCAWRNKDESESLQVVLNTRKHRVVARTDIDGTKVDDRTQRDAIIDQVAKALATPKGVARLQVVIQVRLDEMAEVYPSQSFKENGNGRALSSVLIETENGIERQAIIHNQKIGNAIRQIDNWYGEEQVPTLAVEPFGIDRSLDRAIRIEKKRDFYSLLQKKTLSYRDQMVEANSLDSFSGDMFYYVACLIRGGVFSGKEG